MPDDDLLRYVIGPEPYSAWWPWLSGALVLGVIAWYAWLFMATSSSERIGDVRLIRTVRDEMIKRRAVRDIRGIARRHRSGDLSAPAAGAALSREVRRFLHAATGLGVQYMHVGAIAAGPASAAAPLLSELVDVQFNPSSDVDVGQACATAEALVMRWS
ncbi:hypothetical protein OS122_14275 [Mycolicibacterium mucogenicum]|uniref:hypothetical protein n=1 Tax=Mycolicibacterium mucogenicum TaxID=56689 RepID=UPI00226A214C|nr:hypothetical protein [Mycolicibacterium mucogenicum]MCX8562056.1 hypothetical protein [Mycolicibacterium mucogenicum]